MIGVLRRVLSVHRSQRSWKTYERFLRVDPSTMIDPSSSVQFPFDPAHGTQHLTIGGGGQIFSVFSFLRPEARISVGDRCQLGHSQFICASRIAIGNDVIMAWGITVIDSDTHSLFWDERAGDVERCRKAFVETAGRDIARNHDWSTIGSAPVSIGDKAWIGFNVIVLKGVTIGEGAIVGAGSVVTRDIAPWHVAGGNPCRELRRIEPSRPL